MYFLRSTPSMSKTPTLAWDRPRSSTMARASAAVFTSLGFIASSIERIAFDWNRDAAPIRCVNPLDFYSGDQIHTVGASPQVIPPDRDLV